MNKQIVLLAVSILFLVANSVFAIPVAPPNTARAEYNPATGNIKISANKVINWYVEHLGHDSMTGDDAAGLPAAGGLATDNDTRIGESWFTQISADVDLGNVAALGIPDDGSLVICFNYALSPPLECYPVAFVPEPSSLFLTSSLAWLVCCYRRRTSTANV